MTDMGKTRNRNEDSFFLLPDVGVAVVADGMGGHPSGNVASRIAAETAARALGKELALGPPPGLDAATRLSVTMRRAVIRAHHAIRAEGERDPELDGMGTTLTAIALDPRSDLFVLGHVGDSRAYQYRNGRLLQLTRDDTWVQERIEANLLTPDQARRHPFAHLLTQCLGLEDTPTPSVTHGTVEIGDMYLLCTDGLAGMLADKDLERILEHELAGEGVRRGTEAALRALLDAANEAGGHDNITAVLVTIGPP
jgi:protein phosphatase